MTTTKEKLADAGIDTTDEPAGPRPLPDFEGREVNGQRFIFTGSHKIPAEHHDPHRLEQVLYAVVQVRVLHVDPKLGAKGEMTRVETTTVTRFGFLPIAEGHTLLEKYAFAGAAELPLGDAIDGDIEDDE
jgi:hypothetical protein